MGTEVYCKSYYLNKNTNSSSWPQCYDDKILTVNHHSDHFFQRQTTIGYSENDKEILRQAMLKHEAIFRDQVYELHRLYQVQQNFMDKLKRNELQNYEPPMGGASQSLPFSSLLPSDHIQKLWRIPQNPLAMSSCTSTSITNNTHSLINFCKESSNHMYPVPGHEKCNFLNSKPLDLTSRKHPIKKFELQLPADEYLACEERRQIDASNASDSERDTEHKHMLTDLNEPYQVEEALTAVPVNCLDPASCNERSRGNNLCSKTNPVFVGLSLEYLQNTWRGRDNRMDVNIQLLEIKGNMHELDMQTHHTDFCPGSSSVSSWIRAKRIPCTKPSASLNKRSKLSNLEEVSHGNDIFHQSEFDSSHNGVRLVGFNYNCPGNSVASEDIEDHNTAKYNKGSECRDEKSAKETGVPNTAKLFGFPILSKFHVSEDQVFHTSLSDPLQHPSEAVEAQNTAEVGKIYPDLSYSGQKHPRNNLVEGEALNMDFSGCAKHIRSNSCTIEEKALPITTIRKYPQTDLVSPVDPDTNVGVSTEDVSSKNQLEKCILSSQTGKDEQQEHVKIAAETIVIISTSGYHAYVKDAICPPLEATLTEPLHCFAEVITSVTGDLESRVCGNDDDGMLSPGMDYFESMTLKLTETKGDEYCYNHLMPENLAVTSSRMTQRCRGKGRRGGQQRNFQRDILPVFASLTKHEVSEDLEMLEGLMRSMGHSWQIGSARRNTTRNGRARGTGRSKGCTLIPAETTV